MSTVSCALQFAAYAVLVLICPFRWFSLLCLLPWFAAIFSPNLAPLMMDCSPDLLVIGHSFVFRCWPGSSRRPSCFLLPVSSYATHCVGGCPVPTSPSSGSCRDDSPSSVCCARRLRWSPVRRKSHVGGFNQGPPPHSLLATPGYARWLGAVFDRFVVHLNAVGMRNMSALCGGVSVCG